MLPYVLVFLGTSLAGLAVYLGCVRIAREIAKLASEVSSLQPRVNVSVSGEGGTAAAPAPEKASPRLPESVLAEIASIRSEGFDMGGSASGEVQETILEDDFSGLAEGLRRTR